MTEWLHFHFSLSCIGEGNGNPLQCSCLENPRDGGAWWAAVYGVAQSWTRLTRLSSSSSSSAFTKSYQVSVLGLWTQVASLKNWWQAYEIEILSKNGAGMCVTACALCLRYLVLLCQHKPWLSYTQENDLHSLTTGCLYEVLLSILWNSWEIDPSSVPYTSTSGIHSCEKRSS